MLLVLSILLCVCDLGPSKEADGAPAAEEG